MDNHKFRENFPFIGRFLASNNCRLLAKFVGVVFVYEIFILVVIFLFDYYPFYGMPAFQEKVLPYTLLLRWDSVHYLSMAASEHLTSGVFFPLYPLLIKIFGGSSVEGFFISWLSLTLALFFFYKLMLPKEDEKVIKKTLLFLLIAPNAIFFSMIYTESLFLFLSLACFYFLQQKRWWLAGIFGFFLALTRNVGIFLFPVFWVAYWQANWSIVDQLSINWIRKIWLIFKKKWHSGLAWSLLIPGGLASYMLLCYLQSGDALSFVHNQASWHEYRTFVWPWKFFGAMTHYLFYYKVNFFDFFSNNPQGLYDYVRVFAFSGTAYIFTAFAAIYFLVKKYWSYAAYVLLNLILFSTIFPLCSVERYVVVIFPTYLMLAKASSKRDWLFYFILMFSALFFIFNLFRITHGWWLG
jgi:Gpi18-like mannosyltransferase